MNATQHFKDQRLSAVALLILIPIFIYGISTINIHNHKDWQNLLSNLFYMTVAVSMTLSLLYHAYLGMQVIVEDYIHHKAVRLFILMTLKIVYLGAGIIALMSLIKIWVQG